MNIHEGTTCNGCAAENFRGRCYRCLTCNDFDLCGECYDCDFFNEEHAFDHPVKCTLTQADIDLYFNGEYVSGEMPQSYRCPYCKVWGFNESSLLEHLTATHPQANPALISLLVDVYEQHQAAQIFLEEEQLGTFSSTANERNRMVIREIGIELYLRPLNRDGSYADVPTDTRVDHNADGNQNNTKVYNTILRRRGRRCRRLQNNLGNGGNNNDNDGTGAGGGSAGGSRGNASGSGSNDISNNNSMNIRHRGNRNNHNERSDSNSSYVDNILVHWHRQVNHANQQHHGRLSSGPPLNATDLTLNINEQSHSNAADMEQQRSNLSLPNQDNGILSFNTTVAEVMRLYGFNFNNALNEVNSANGRSLLSRRNVASAAAAVMNLHGLQTPRRRLNAQQHPVATNGTESQINNINGGLPGSRAINTQNNINNNRLADIFPQLRHSFTGHSTDFDHDYIRNLLNRNSNNLATNIRAANARLNATELGNIEESAITNELVKINGDAQSNATAEIKHKLLKEFLKQKRPDESYANFLATRAEFVSQLVLSALIEDKLSHAKTINNVKNLIVTEDVQKLQKQTSKLAAAGEVIGDGIEIFKTAEVVKKKPIDQMHAVVATLE